VARYFPQLRRIRQICWYCRTAVTQSIYLLYSIRAVCSSKKLDTRCNQTSHTDTTSSNDWLVGWAAVTERAPTDMIVWYSLSPSRLSKYILYLN
jgi:hypothetical protein